MDHRGQRECRDQKGYRDQRGHKAPREEMVQLVPKALLAPEEQMERYLLTN